MRVLIACEESQEVCKAFRKLGHDAFSCDIQECSGEHPEWHIQDDVLKHFDDNWDLMIAHPPCTYISYAGTKWWNDQGRLWKRLDALCKICGVNETNNPDGICDDCKLLLALMIFHQIYEMFISFLLNMAFQTFYQVVILIQFIK